MACIFDSIVDYFDVEVALLDIVVDLLAPIVAFLTSTVFFSTLVALMYSSLLHLDHLYGSIVVVPSVCMIYKI